MSGKQQDATWESLRAKRMAEPGVVEEYEATKLAYELGVAVRQRREEKGWSQAELARAAGMTQSAVARFEAGGTVPTLRILERLADALDSELLVQFRKRPAKRSRPAAA